LLGKGKILRGGRIREIVVLSGDEIIGKEG